ncbi:MAG: T9SS type A sorting domain-containing protein [Chitinophagales bacterium]
MKHTLTLLVLCLNLISIKAQIATEITDLQTPELDETSGLLFYNDKIITFNDSGGEANLYEIDINNGNITRTVTISNATNIDWEDIAQDESYIYIGDIGNNNGNRNDLIVYKIAKNDYNTANDTAIAESISYSYANQVDFTSNPNNTNWDAEAMISFEDKLLIFSKNWVDNMTNVYSIPKTSGTHTAILESSYDTDGLITGAEATLDESTIYLTGYSSSEAPFLYKIESIPDNSLDVFSGIVSEKISDIAPIGNQVEAIALNNENLYITNERFTFTSGSLEIVFPAKLWQIDNATANVDASTNLNLTIFPNPSIDILNISQKVDEITVFDWLGKVVLKEQNVEELSVENLKEGNYIIHLKNDDTRITKQIIKYK